MISMIHISLILPCIWCLYFGTSVAQSGLHKLSKLPDQFSLHQELIDGIGKKIAGFTEIVDCTGKLARMDMVPPDRSDLSAAFGSRPLTVISDFNTGHRYVIDRWARNCTQTPLPSHSWMSRADGSTYVRMKHSYHIFDKINLNGDYTFINKTTVRSIPVLQYSMHNSTLEEDLYLLDPSWSSTPDVAQITETDIPVAFQVKTFNETNGLRVLISQQMYHIYGFYVGQPVEDTFSIADCFSYRQKSKSLMFLIKGSHQTDVYRKHEQVYTAVRNAIATHANISPLRVTDVALSTSPPIYLDVTFVLRDHPTNRGNVRNVTDELSLREATDNLNNSITMGFNITVPYRDGLRKLEVVTHSLKYYSKRNKQSSPTSYTPGQMAGLAIGMIILGFFIGIAAACIIRQRLNTEVPYKVN